MNQSVAVGDTVRFDVGGRGRLRLARRTGIVVRMDSDFVLVRYEVDGRKLAWAGPLSRVSKVVRDDVYAVRDAVQRRLGSRAGAL